VAIADPQAALDYLHRQGEYTTAPRPDLILLDLELGGYELLAAIKGDNRLRRIPIIVLTLSDCPDDIFQTYAIQGNCYVIHPSDRDQLTQILHRIEEFWLNIVTLPQE
jgi:chemotaxis family two-component system response regulator Rcp1